MTGADVMTAGVGGALMAGLMTSCAMQGRKASEVLSLLKNYKEPAPEQETSTEQELSSAQKRQEETKAEETIKQAS